VKVIVPVVLLAMASAADAAPKKTEAFGRASLTGVHSSQTGQTDDEELDGSALVARGDIGVRLDPRGNTSRLQVTSSYYGYFDRNDRWSNGVEAEQLFRLRKGLTIGVEGAAVTNVLTLESRSADQVRLGAQATVESGNHRYSVSAGTRRRWYDGSSATSWAPFAEIGYRYRFGSWHFLDLDARAERVNSDRGSLDYKRLAVSGYYTRPFDRHTRVRLGLTQRSWTWDERRTATGDRRRERLWLPQVRLTHDVTSRLSLDLDYRRIIRRSNDPAFSRDGSRLAATLRTDF